MDVRCECSKLGLATNLIVHHSIVNFPNHTTEHICILDIGKESLNLPLLCQLNQSSENFLQFPNILLVLDLNFRRCGLTVAVPSSLIPPSHHPQKQVDRVSQRGL